jgi:hypothetical protein
VVNAKKVSTRILLPSGVLNLVSLPYGVMQAEPLGTAVAGNFNLINRDAYCFGVNTGWYLRTDEVMFYMTM